MPLPLPPSIKQSGSIMNKEPHPQHSYLFNMPALKEQNPPPPPSLTGDLPVCVCVLCVCCVCAVCEFMVWVLHVCVSWLCVYVGMVCVSSWYECYVCHICVWEVERVSVGSW